MSIATEWDERLKAQDNCWASHSLVPRPPRPGRRGLAHEGEMSLAVGRIEKAMLEKTRERCAEILQQEIDYMLKVRQPIPESLYGALQAVRALEFEP